MTMSTSRSLLCSSALACLTLLSACSEKKAANVSFQDIDRSTIPTNIVANSDLGGSATEWTGWKADLVNTNGAQATFALESYQESQGGNSLRVSVANVEVESAAGDIQAGPAAVPVKAGQVYGVGAFVQGPRCGVANFVVHAAGDPSTVLVEEELYFSGGLQSFDYYFQVPDAGVTSVDMPVQLSFADNIGGEIIVDRITAIPTVMPAPGDEGNAAHNSNFEESNTSINVPFGKDNTNSWANSVGAAFSLDTAEAQDGNNSVRIDFEAAGTGEPYAIEGGPVNVPVKEGFTYIFSAWIKGAEGGKANFLVQNPTAYNVYAESGPVTFTSEWQEVRFSATVSGTEKVRLYAQYNFPENANKTIYIDNIKLIPPDTCPYASADDNLVSNNQDLFEYDHVINGGLEESDTEYPGWNAQISGSAQAVFEVTKTLANSGNNALKTTITTVGDNASDIQAGPTGLLVKPGQTYIYSTFVRAALGAQLGFSAVLQEQPSTVLADVKLGFNGNNWAQVTFDFAVPADAPVLTAEQLEAAGLAEDALVTQISLPINMSYPTNVGRRIFLDDFTLLPNAAANGDLENSTTEAEGWSWQAADGAATFAINTSDAFTGANSLMIDVAEIATGATIDLWDIQAGIADIPVSGGRKYYISTRIKGDVGAKAKILLDLASDPFTEYGSVSGEDSGDEDTIPDGIEITAEWQEVTFAVDVPEGVDAVRLMAQLGFAENSNKTIYLDTFRVVSQIPPPPKAATANIVTNGGLESGNTDGWNGNGATIAVTTSAAGVYSGNFAMHATARTAAWNSAQYSLVNAGLEEGGRYLVTSFVKVDGDTADNLKLSLVITYDDGTDATDEYFTLAESGAEGTLAWTSLNGFFDYSPNGTVADVKVYVETAGAETSYYLDDLFVTKVFTVNGDLELGDATGWNGSGSAAIVASTDDSHGGDYSLHVSGRTANWNSAQFNLVNTGMEPGRTYQISAWVKIDGDTPDILKMTVEVQDENNDQNRYLGLAQSADTLDWVKLSSTYTYAPDGDPTAIVVYFEGELVDSAYYVDDLVITEVIPPVNIITNGNLEYGRTDGWNENNAKMTVINSAAGVYSGNFGLQVTDRAANWHSAQLSLVEAGLVEGASYMASAWVKVIGDVADTLKLTLAVTDSEGTTQWIEIANSGAADTLSWTKLSGFFSYAPIGTVNDVKIYVESSGDTTAYYLDDLTIQQMYTPNGNLESSTTEATGWSAAGAQMSLVTDEVYSGTQSLYVSDRTEGWHSAQYDLLNSGMEVGKTYEISAWVKIEGDVADAIKMTVQVDDEDNTNSQYLTIAQSSETLTWVKLSSTYTYVPGGTVTTFKVYFEAVTPTSAYYIDDLVIREASESYSY